MIDSFGLNEHLDYLKNYIPQPFGIKSSDVVSFKKDVSEDDYSYVIETTNNKFTLSKPSLKKLVDSLGVKIKLLDEVCSETNVIDLALPIIDKLFKCFSDCFVFYASTEDRFYIIDLNVNSTKGEPGTMFENGPSPWSISIEENKSSFTCFADFKDKYSADDSVLVKADDILSGSSVNMNLFREVVGSQLQPMLTFSSKFSNLNGFSDIHATLYDQSSDIYIQFPMNYAKNEDSSFDNLWRMATHLHDTFDVNDFIFQEVSELAASDDTPNNIRNFISSVLVDSVINVNQPIKDILADAVTICNGLKPAKAKKLRKSLGHLIAWCVCMKHNGCSECHHLHI